MKGDKPPSPDESLREFTIWQENTPGGAFDGAVFVAGISPAGTFAMFREDIFTKYSRTEAVMQCLLHAKAEIDQRIKELQQ